MFFSPIVWIYKAIPRRASHAIVNDAFRVYERRHNTKNVILNDAVLKDIKPPTNIKLQKLHGYDK